MAVLQDLVSNNRQTDPMKVASLDSDYLTHKGVNFHRIYGQVLLGIHNHSGRDFKTFREERNSADYELGASFNPTDSATKVKEMWKLFNIIHNI